MILLNNKKEVNLYSWKANHRFNWHQFIPAVSVYGGANLFQADNPYRYPDQPSISPKFMLITQNRLGDGSFILVSNIIADFNGPSYGYIITLTKGISEKWSAFLENQGYMSDYYSDAIVRGGAAYLIHDDLQIDASISGSLKNTPSILYGGIGFSWRYDVNYKEVRINIDNNGKAKAKSESKSKAATKRKDQIEAIPEK